MAGEEKLQAGWFVLAMCILAEKYTCPEKAFAYYYNRMPLVKHPARWTWINDEIIDEMQELYRNGVSQKDISELFGVSPTVVQRKVNVK